MNKIKETKVLLHMINATTWPLICVSLEDPNSKTEEKLNKYKNDAHLLYSTASCANKRPEICADVLWSLHVFQ